MERIEQKMKLIIDWSIGKKKHIHELVINHLSVYRHIKSFVNQYISHLQDLVDIVERASIESLNAKDPQTMTDLFQLIKSREKNNIQSWRNKIQIMENKYRGQTQTTTAAIQKKFPDIFKDIDQDISYYGILRDKMKQLILKKNISLSEKMKDQHEIGRRSPLKANPQTICGKYLRINRFGELYDKKYVQQLNPDPKQKQKVQPRQIGKIRGNYSPRKSTQYSPYKLVNPRYSPINFKDRSYQTDRQYSYTILEQALPRSFTDKPNKYEKHKIDLKEQMDQAYKNQSFTVHTPNKTHKNNDRADYSTANSNKDACESVNSTKIPNSKKYTYLFDNDQELQPSFFRNQQKVKKILFEDPHKTIKVPCLQHNDSSSFLDELGKKLEVDTPDTFEDKHKQDVDLQLVLASSLLSSKKWDSREQAHLSDDDSQKDSLDELSSNIASTGKFPSLARNQEKYGNENRQNEDDEQDEITYPYRRVVETCSKLNFSFGNP